MIPKEELRAGVSLDLFEQRPSTPSAEREEDPRSTTYTRLSTRQKEGEGPRGRPAHRAALPSGEPAAGQIEAPTSRDPVIGRHRCGRLPA